MSPEKTILEGKFCRLVPLSVDHSVDLFNAIKGEQSAVRHQYLFETPPNSPAELRSWIEQVSASSDMLFFAVINKATGKCGGRQALMRITPQHCVIEIGSILWGQGIAKTALATEALFLTAQYIFEDLGYRRFEWKCNNLNAPSKRAALRFGFGFEGVFAQHMIIKGHNRDTAWFAMLDRDWPSLKEKYIAWLAPDNFDAKGLAKTSLATPRQPTPVQY